MTNKASSFPAAPPISPLHRHGGKITAGYELPIHALGDDYTVDGSGTVQRLPTMPAGVIVTLRITATPKFINSAKLRCSIGGDYTAAPNDLIIMRSSGDGVWNAYIASAPLPRMYLSGLATQNNISTPTTDIDIASGSARNSTDTGNITLPTGITKRISTAWAAGSGNGGLDTGSIASGVLTSYHGFVIGSSNSSVPVDGLFSLSPTAPTLPTGYDWFRRIGSFVWTSANLVRLYHQFGNTFLWDSQVVDRSSTSALAFGLIGISVPSNIVVQPMFDAQWLQNAAGQVVVSVWDATLGASSNNCGGRGVSTFGTDQGMFSTSGGIFTNSSAQINAAVQLIGGATLTSLSLMTRGWIDNL